MPGANLINRLEKHIVKTLTFDGTSVGDVGTDLVFNVTGRVLLKHLQAFCSTGLTGATATIELGVAGNTAGLIAQATATDLIANEYWNDATPTDLLTAGALTDLCVASDVILTVGTAAVTAGVIEFSALWVPMSVDGNVG